MSSAAAVAQTLAGRQSFILTSHARPDGDAIGSQLALGLALEQIGKSVQFVGRDPVPRPYQPFPGTDRIRLTAKLEARADALIVLECSDLTRPGIAGLESQFIVNIDHHVGNRMYGHVNWFDASAAACGELVADIIDALDVQWTRDIASHLFLALATDTGGFRYGPMSERTFEICRRIVAAGVDPGALSRQIFDSFSIGRVKLMGALLNRMTLHHDNRFAVLSFDDALLAASGADTDDTEGLVNLPLGAREVIASAMIKISGEPPKNVVRVSLRSKGQVDVQKVAARWGGGGHHNAAGLTTSGSLEQIRDQIVGAVGEQLTDRFRGSGSSGGSAGSGSVEPEPPAPSEPAEPRNRGRG